MRSLGQWSSQPEARGMETLDGREESGRRKLYTCQLCPSRGNPRICQRALPGIVRLPMNLIMGTRSAAAEARRTLVANILMVDLEKKSSR
jgi:hypothetical protein